MHRDPSLARRTALLFVALALLLGVKGPAPADQSAPPPEGDDLSSFSTWLHGLKR